MQPSLIPTVDPAGLPGPPWLFHVLLVLTFVLHMLFMNLALGGSLLAAVAHTLSRGRAGDPRTVLAGRLTAINGYGISLAITTGVAPLLFVQVLYQQFFYTATILLGWVWFAFLLMLLVGYYSAYVYKFRGVPSGRPGGGVWLWLTAILFLGIVMVHVGVHLLQVQPDRWAAAGAGSWTVLADPTYWPRLAHFVLAALAFTALIVAWWAAREGAAGREREINRAIAVFAWWWALVSTVLQVVDGFVLLALLPRRVLLRVMQGGPATLAPLTVAIVLGIGLLMMLSRIRDPLQARSTVTGTLAAMVLTIVVMSVTRHQIRALYLDPVAAGTEYSVEAQWGNVVLFAAVVTAGLATVAFMVRRVLNSPATGEKAA